ncbi:MAG: DUF72 domain-containing protein [Xanthomonadaceae bacterium]|nr:DUF72 domain-containing protein [Xanthomonadaceae bacterium]
MAIWVGTSGYNYPEWKGTFYPEKIAAANMLRYYAQRFPTVEINYTYYRMPNQKTLQNWDQQTPPRYKLTLKAPKRITHDARLKDCADPLRYFTETAAKLGPKLGALLFQLPPSFKKNLEVFDAFLECLPVGVCAAFEFRHGSWLCDEVYERLKARNLALCIADNENFWTPPEITASYAYFRLRDEGYTQDDIVRWADTVRDKTAACSDVYVYFKHEEEGKGPEFAAAFMAAVGASRV